MTITSILLVIIPLVITSLATVFGPIIVDHIRHRRRKIACRVKDAVPIELEGGRNIGAYLVEVANVSKSSIKDVTCHIAARPATLRNGGISESQGLDYQVQEAGEALQITIPYLKGGDQLAATVIAEGGYIPQSPKVAIRSPQDPKVAFEDPNKANPDKTWQMVISGVLAGAACVGVLYQVTSDTFYRTQQDVLTFAASVSGLTRLAELYTASSNLSYYSQGDLAFARAAECSDRSEIEKYRKFLKTVLQAEGSIHTSSQANLYYCLGKIDLLLGDKDQAVRDFKEAQAKSKTLVEGKIKIDSDIRDFFSKNGML